MKKGKKIVCMLLCLFSFFCGAERVWAGEELEWMDEIFKELRLEEMDEVFSGEITEKIRFEDVVKSLTEDGLEGEFQEKITSWVYDIFFYELAAGKDDFIQILGITILFALLQKLLMIRNSYVVDVSFLLIYAAVMTLLLESFSLMSTQALEGLDAMIEFMMALIPVYASTLLVTGNGATAGVFYEMAFVLIAVIQWAMKYLFVPGIHIYLILRFLNPLLGDDKLSGICQLMEDGLLFLQKAALMVMVGFTAIQSLLSPAKDLVNQSTWYKGLSSIPGVGNSFGGAGEILFSCGTLIKNSVGVAALIFLLSVSLLPVIKTTLFLMLYKILGAVLMPVADKRLISGIGGVEMAGRLYQKVIVNSFVLFFLTIAMITASSSFMR